MTIQEIIEMDINIIATGSSGNCVRVSDNKTQLLFDVGIPFKQIQKSLNYDLTGYNVLVSHKHGDHSKSLKDFYNRGNEVFCGVETARDILHLDENNDGTFGTTNLHILENLKQYTIGSFVVRAFNVKHINSDFSDCENFGFIVYSTITKETLVYMTDFMYCEYKLPQADYYLIECNYEDSLLENEDINRTVQIRRLKSHCSLSTFCDLLDKTDLSKCKKLYIIHTSQNADKEFIKNTIVARYGVLTGMA